MLHIFCFLTSVSNFNTIKQCAAIRIDESTSFYGPVFKGNFVARHLYDVISEKKLIVTQQEPNNNRKPARIKQ